MSTTFGFLLAPCRCILSRCDVHPSGCLSVAYIPPSPPKCDLTKKNSPQGISGCSHTAVGEARRDTMLPSILVFSPTDEKLFRTQRSAVVSCGQMKRGIQGAWLAVPTFFSLSKQRFQKRSCGTVVKLGPKDNRMIRNYVTIGTYILGVCPPRSDTALSLWIRCSKTRFANEPTSSTSLDASVDCPPDYY